MAQWQGGAGFGARWYPVALQSIIRALKGTLVKFTHQTGALGQKHTDTWGSRFILALYGVVSSCKKKNTEKRYSHLPSWHGADGANGHEGGEKEDESGDFGVHDDVPEGGYSALNSERTVQLL